MRRNGKILLPILLTAAFWIGAPAAYTEPLAPKEHAFEVDIPGTPTHKEESRSIGVGNVTSENFIVDTAGSTYFVSAITIPRLASAFAPDSVLYGQTRDGMLEDIEGTQLSFEEIRRDGHEGRHLLYEMNPTDAPSRKGEAQFFRMGKKMYLFAAHGLADDAPARTAFFGSIKLTD